MSVPNVGKELLLRRGAACGHVHPLEQGVACLFCRYLINGWLTKAYLIHHSVIPYSGANVMVRNPFLIEMETLLRVNMLFNWIRGDYGPWDDFSITMADITDVWVDIMGVPFYPHGFFYDSRLKFYLLKEKTFWDEMKTGDYRIVPAPLKKPKGRA